MTVRVQQSNELEGGFQGAALSREICAHLQEKQLSFVRDHAHDQIRLQITTQGTHDISLISYVEDSKFYIEVASMRAEPLRSCAEINNHLRERGGHLDSNGHMWLSIVYCWDQAPGPAEMNWMFNNLRHELQDVSAQCLWLSGESSSRSLKA